MLDQLINVRRHHMLLLRFGDRRNVLEPLESQYQAAERDLLDAISWVRFLGAAGLDKGFHGRKAGRILADRRQRFSQACEAWHAGWDSGAQTLM